MALGGYAPTSIAAEWKRIGQPGRQDARNISNAAQHFIEIDILLSLRGILRSWIHAHGGRPLRPETHIHIEDTQKTPDQQARANQKNTGERDFRNNQRTANP